MFYPGAFFTPNNQLDLYHQNEQNQLRFLKESNQINNTLNNNNKLISYFDMGHMYNNSFIRYEYLYRQNRQIPFELEHLNNHINSKESAFQYVDNSYYTIRSTNTSRSRKNKKTCTKENCSSCNLKNKPTNQAILPTSYIHQQIPFLPRYAHDINQVSNYNTAPKFYKNDNIRAKSNTLKKKQNRSKSNHSAYEHEEKIVRSKSKNDNEINRSQSRGKKNEIKKDKTNLGINKEKQAQDDTNFSKNSNTTEAKKDDSFAQETKNEILVKNEEENDKNLIQNKSSEQINAPPPPPPPPLDVDLFKSSNTSFIFNRMKKIKKTIPDEASKSFDAVVNELKSKLNKMKPSDENLIKVDTLIKRSNNSIENINSSSEKLANLTKSKSHKILINEYKLKTFTSKLQNESSKSSSSNLDIRNTNNNEYSNLNEMLGTLRFTQKNLTYNLISDNYNLNSNSSVNAFGQSNKLFKKKSWLNSSGSEQTTSNPNLDMTQLSNSSTNSQNLINSLIETKIVKEPIPISKSNNEKVSSSNKIISSSEKFKLEILNDSENELSDDYEKYDRVKFSPIKNLEMSSSSKNLSKNSSKMSFDSVPNLNSDQENELKNIKSNNDTDNNTNELNSKQASKLSSSISFRDKTNQILKKIQKRNTFSNLNNKMTKKLINLDQIGNENESENLLNKQQPETKFENRLVKSKSDYMNFGQNKINNHENSDQHKLIKIESLVDLTSNNKQNIITAFSTRNFFQNFDNFISQNETKNETIVNETQNEQKSTKNEAKSLKTDNIREFIKIKTVIKNKEPEYLLKSKSEAKLFTNKSLTSLRDDELTSSNKELIIKPVPRGLIQYGSLSNTKKTNMTKENLKVHFDQNEKTNSKANGNYVKSATSQIPSKFSSFTDLTKNKKLENVRVKNFNSLNNSASNTNILFKQNQTFSKSILNKNQTREMCMDLIVKAAEYDIKLPNLLKNLESKLKNEKPLMNYSNDSTSYDYDSFLNSNYEYSLNDVQFSNNEYLNIKYFDDEVKLNEYLNSFYKNLNDQILEQS